MANDFSENDNDALYTICLFLAQSGDPHEELGYTTQVEAFSDLGIKFSVPANTVKNERDAYDRHTDSERVGWNQPLPPRLKNVFEYYQKLSRSDLLRDAKTFLTERSNHAENELRMADLFTNIVSETDALINVRKPQKNYVVEFSNTGRRSDGWFELTISQLSQTLDDLITHQTSIIKETGSLADYDETTWRSLFDNYLSDDVARTVGRVQTLPLFELLSKIIHHADSGEMRQAKKIELGLEKLDKAKAALQYWVNVQHSSVSPQKTKSVMTGGENVIFYGAPGTGKSYRVNQEVSKSPHQPIRTVFHPDLQNSDFFGCLKPRMNGADVRYEFAPGPFMMALVMAHNFPEDRVYLVIEELNRAASAAVFGDLFLLLDRDEDGEGEYTVDFPSPESKSWFEDETKGDHSKLKIPPNLFIYATMNSADQGVFPIDTAFRRRWRQVYIPLNEAAGPDGEVTLFDKSKKRYLIQWRVFVDILNSFLTSSDHILISEDRLLGRWFVKQSELQTQVVPEKVLLYLWDDLLRHEGRDLIFDNKIKTYGELEKKKFSQCVFSNAFSNELVRNAIEVEADTTNNE